MATDTDNVCLLGKTGSDRRTVKSALMTHLRHWLCTAATVLLPVSAPIKVLAWAYTMLPSELEGGHAAAGISGCYERRSCNVAARGARAAADVAGDRVFEQHVVQPVRTVRGRIPAGPERNRLYRRPERNDRVPLGGGSI